MEGLTVLLEFIWDDPKGVLIITSSPLHPKTPITSLGGIPVRQESMGPIIVDENGQQRKDIYFFRLIDLSDKEKLKRGEEYPIL